MEVKEMREALKAAGQTVPRKNDDVIEAYGKLDTLVEKPKSSERVFVYLGQGEESPSLINFMGQQKFTKGKPETITDSTIIAKLEGNGSFEEVVEKLTGNNIVSFQEKVMEMIAERETTARAEADRKRAAEVEFLKKSKRQNG